MVVMSLVLLIGLLSDSIDRLPHAFQSANFVFADCAPFFLSYFGTVNKSVIPLMYNLCGAEILGC